MAKVFIPYAIHYSLFFVPLPMEMNTENYDWNLKNV